MASITQAQTNNNLEAVTRPALIKRYLLESGLGFTGTATGGSTTTVVDTTRLDGSGYNSEDLVGAYVRISTAGAAAPEGEVRIITGYTVGTGTIDVDPAFTAAVAANDTYEIHKVLHPQEVLDFLTNFITHEYYLFDWSILSDVDDFDMEDSGVTSWSETGGGTRSKVTGLNALAGSQSLEFVASADSDYVSNTNAIYIDPGQTYTLSSLIRVTDATSAKIELYDETNSTALDSITVSTFQTVRAWKNIGTPATCKQVSIRLYALGGSRTAVFDEVVLFRPGDKDIALPRWVRHPDQVKGKFRLRPTALQNATSSVYSPELIGTMDEAWDVQDGPLGDGRLRLVSRVHALTYPMFICGVRNETDYSTETETKNLASNYVVTALCLKAFENITSFPLAASISLEWAENKRRIWETKYKKEQIRHSSRLAQALSETQPDVWVPSRDRYWSNVRV